MERVNYDRPREKLLRRGVSSLSDNELLQLIIGSGTARFPVARIARKILTILKKRGSTVSYEELREIQGLGIARISLILALFEIAGRYPVKLHSARAVTSSDFLSLFVAHRNTIDVICVYITLDGGSRVISKRKTTVNQHVSHSTLLRVICSDVLGDGAAGVVISFIASDRPLEPTNFELLFAKDLHSSSQLLAFVVRDLFTLNESHEHSFWREGNYG